MNRAFQRQRQYGFSLVSAIFIIVVLAGLGAFMVTLNSLQHATSSAALQGARAFQAAQSGIEWGVYQAIVAGTACSASPASTTTGPFGLSAPGLDGFQVTVICSFTSHQERSDNYNVYTINSIATYGAFGTPNFASRSLVVTVTSAP